MSYWNTAEAVLIKKSVYTQIIFNINDNNYIIYVILSDYVALYKGIVYEL